jgi:hypothetical protein
MIWAAITAEGIACYEFVEGILNGADYMAIIKKKLPKIKGLMEGSLIF